MKENENKILVFIGVTLVVFSAIIMFLIMQTKNNMINNREKYNGNDIHLAEATQKTTTNTNNNNGSNKTPNSTANTNNNSNNRTPTPLPSGYNYQKPTSTIGQKPNSNVTPTAIPPTGVLIPTQTGNVPTQTTNIPTPSGSDDLGKQCYVKIENGKENTYCYGDATSCDGYTKVVPNKSEDDCNENRLCYKLNNKDYVVGKYEGQDNYVYVGKECPACYTDKDGTLKWGNYENTEGYTKNNGITDEANCKTEVKDNNVNGSKSIILYILLGIAVLVLLYLLLSSGKNKRQNNYEM